MNTDGEKGLKGLVDAFSPMFSGEEISSAYCEARKDADDAGLILYNKLGASTDSDVHCGMPRGDLSEGIFSEATKSLKLDLELRPMSEISVGNEPRKIISNQMHKEMEDFLFKMFGEGFHLDRHVIQDVLGKCGYDMQKFMDRLFNLSSSNLKRRKQLQQESSLKYKDSYSRAGVGLQQRKIRHSGRGSGDLGGPNKDDEELRRKLYRNNQEKEVLVSLFYSTGKLEELTITAAEKSETRALVVESGEKLVESTERMTLVNESNKSDPKLEILEEYEGSYEALRKAMLEYRDTMKEYHSAAIEAYQTGDQIRAYKLQEKGSFFQKKAREAYDESAKKIFETSNTVDEQDHMTLDLNLHEYEPREAIRLLKQHLSSLAGNPAFRYLKAIIETDDEDSSKGARRQRILRLLERHSLKIEEGTAGTILIPLDQSFSFVKG
ncbi:hypothetical protein SAY87_018908 [Trapa incisa]|uniref:DUF1771 domain-containing protein n=1 Tax=Trapa incisa TaxID=236973 RepID=A0AAN7Q0V7_9MYRT|nr:hypothetical protein SAY87_018908 [Trapa incisa]